jgi:hypothetical protein
MKLKIFSNLEFLLDDFTLTPILHTFWTEFSKKNNIPGSDSMTPIIKSSRSFFDISSLDSPPEFVDLQHECRRLWQEWLSPEGFFANFYRHFQIGMAEKIHTISL